MTTTTIQDVAARAGVSVSTVSNVLNGRESRMRAETLGRVQTAIAELGFRPNQSARMLKTGHMPMIGLMVPTVANPFYGVLARWVEARARSAATGCCCATPTATPSASAPMPRPSWRQGFAA